MKVWSLATWTNNLRIHHVVEIARLDMSVATLLQSLCNRIGRILAVQTGSLAAGHPHLRSGKKCIVHLLGRPFVMEEIVQDGASEAVWILLADLSAGQIGWHSCMARGKSGDVGDGSNSVRRWTRH